MKRSVVVLTENAHVVVAAVVATLLTVWVMNAWLSPPPTPPVDDVELRTASAPAAGTILTGSFNAWATGGGGFMGDKSQFPSKLSYAVADGRSEYIQGSAYTANCPGLGQVVPRGYLCFYVSNAANATFGASFNPNDGSQAAASSRTGFAMYWFTSGSGGAYAYGQWTMKVGGAAQAPRTGSDRTQAVPGPVR